MSRVYSERRHCKTCLCHTEERTCPGCGTTFTVGNGEKNFNAIYCTRRCVKAAHQRAYRNRIRAERVTS